MIRRNYVKQHLIKQLCISYLRRRNIRCISSQPSANLVALTNRSVVQVTGKDSAKLLQGLITNDVNLLTDKNRSLYSMLLNVNGRIVYDLIVYRGEGPQEYLIECDDVADEDFIYLMKRHKLRSKVYFNKRPDLNIFCIFDCLSMTEEDQTKVLSHESCFKDSRLTQCGTRVLTDATESEFIANLNLTSSMVSVNLKEYNGYRYKIGISEGIGEMSNGIPLEYNLAWLNGVSFNKGCYIGQELVARTHHVGVIRKRVMPLIFSTETSQAMKGVKVVNEKGKRVGKIVDSCGKLALGLMRLKETLGAFSLFCTTADGSEVNITSVKPDWWPALQQ